MNFAQSTTNFFRSVLKSYGPSRIKRVLWDQEFSGGKWNFIDDTAGDCVYPYLERYAASGSILDLGCGPGNTASEISRNAYGTYVGVDISEAALSKGVKRSEADGRAEKNHFVQGDFLNYVPSQKFNVILFRESMYHVPVSKIKSTLDRYANYLESGGVFIVRMTTAGGKFGRLKAMEKIMTTDFEVVEKRQFGERGPSVFVLRPHESTQNAVAQRDVLQETAS